MKKDGPRTHEFRGAHALLVVGRRETRPTIEYLLPQLAGLIRHQLPLGRCGSGRPCILDRRDDDPVGVLEERV